MLAILDCIDKRLVSLHGFHEISRGSLEVQGRIRVFIRGYLFGWSGTSAETTNSPGFCYWAFDGEIRHMTRVEVEIVSRQILAQGLAVGSALFADRAGYTTRNEW